MKFKREIKIGNRLIGDNHPPYVIAEIGSNHNQDLQQAKELIRASADAGADAVKFQSLKFDRLYVKEHTKQSFRDFFKQIELNEDWYETLAETCRSAGIHFLSSPTYLEAIELLREQNVVAFKLASAQVGTDNRLIKQVFEQEKPVFLSTGLADNARIKEVIHMAQETENPKLVLLHCVSIYPPPPEKINLRLIKTFKEQFDCLVGLSDHSLEDYATISAVTLGASVIEKHITFDRQQEGPDHCFSLEIEEFENLIKKIDKTYRSLGDGRRDSLHPEEEKFLNEICLRCVAKQDILKGEKISKQDLSFYRLEEGIDARESEELIGIRTVRDINSGEIIKWRDVADGN